MRSITLSRSVSKLADKNYRLLVEVTSYTTGMEPYIFVYQRLRDPLTNTSNDIFVAIASPEQIESLSKNAPEEGSSYFRLNKVDVVSPDPEYLEYVFENIISEVQKLTTDLDILDTLVYDSSYSIDADTVTITNTVHTHYRIPLFATPAGTAELFDDAGTNRERVNPENTSATGWLNTDGADPVGYSFKYNIDEDTTLSMLWSPSIEDTYKPQLEVNGITKTTGILINETTIYWAENEEGTAPWSPYPLDVVHSGDLTAPVLVIDFIKKGS